jgi:hypothetical protein
MYMGCMKLLEYIKLLYKVILIRPSDIIYFNDYGGGNIRIQLLKDFDIYTNLWIHNEKFTQIIIWKCCNFYKYSNIYNIAQLNIDYIFDISEDGFIFFSNDHIYYTRLEKGEIQKLRYIIRERKLKELCF